jgi:hypothetical protein
MDDREELRAQEPASAEALVDEVVRWLDAMPDAFERAELGLLQAQAGHTVPLDALS